MEENVEKYPLWIIFKRNKGNFVAICDINLRSPHFLIYKCSYIFHIAQWLGCPWSHELCVTQK